MEREDKDGSQGSNQGKGSIFQAAEVHAQDIPDEDTESPASLRPTQKRKLYVTRHTPTTSCTALYPMNAFQMMAELTLAKKMFEKRTAKRSSFQPE